MARTAPALWRAGYAWRITSTLAWRSVPRHEATKAPQLHSAVPRPRHLALPRRCPCPLHPPKPPWCAQAVGPLHWIGTPHSCWSCRAPRPTPGSSCPTPNLLLSARAAPAVTQISSGRCATAAHAAAYNAALVSFAPVASVVQAQTCRGTPFPHLSRAHSRSLVGVSWRFDQARHAGAPAYRSFRDAARHGAHWNWSPACPKRTRRAVSPCAFAVARGPPRPAGLPPLTVRRIKSSLPAANCPRSI